MQLLAYHADLPIALCIGFGLGAHTREARIRIAHEFGPFLRLPQGFV